MRRQIVLLAFAGCAPAAPPAPPIVVAPTAMPPIVEAPEPPKPPEKPDIPMSGVPGEAADSYASTGRWKLRFRPGARPLAVLRGGTLELPEGASGAGAVARYERECRSRTSASTRTIATSPCW